MTVSQAAPRNCLRRIGRSLVRRDALGHTPTTYMVVPALTRPASTSASLKAQPAGTDHDEPPVKGVNPPSKKERVVILGSGWAGYALARELDPNKYERVIISPRSYFVFTPLLASTSVGTLEFRSTLEPVRGLKPDRFHQGWADEINFANKTVTVESNPDADELSSRTLPPIQPPSISKDTSPESGSADSGKTEPELSISASTSTATAHITKKRGELMTVPYDKLVVAVGAYSQTFNIPGVREHANFLRDVGDARAIRLRILQCFERADLPSTTDEQRRKLLHFAIVGGGPTGIEWAAELHDLIHDDLAKLYPQLLPFIAITVYDIAPTVLPMFDKKLSSYAVRQFKRQGIQLKTEHHLQGIRPDDDTGAGGGGLKLKIQEYGDEEVGAGIVVWSTGLMQNPLVQKLVAQEIRTPTPGEKDLASKGVEGQPAADADHAAQNGGLRILKNDKTGTIVVDDHLRVRLQGPETTTSNAASETASDSSAAPASPMVLPDVYALGDCTSIQDRNLPATAQVAAQQAKYLAKALNKHGRLASGLGGSGSDGLEAVGPFHWRNFGTLAYLGSWNAIHQSEMDGLTGRVAWILWRGAYITRSMSIRNKIMVLVHWFMSWMFGRDISRF